MVSILRFIVTKGIVVQHAQKATMTCIVPKALVVCKLDLSKTNTLLAKQKFLKQGVGTLFVEILACVCVESGPVQMEHGNNAECQG